MCYYRPSGEPLFEISFPLPNRATTVHTVANVHNLQLRAAGSEAMDDQRPRRKEVIMLECSGFTPYIVVIFAIALATVATRWIQRKTRKLCKSPPSPKLRIPFLGHIFPLFCGRDLVKKSKKLKSYYGDVFSYQVVGMNTVHICSYELICEALKKSEVSSRIPFQKFPNINKVFSDIYLHGFHGIVVTEGQEWREHRRFAMKTLKGFGLGKSRMEQIMKEKVNTFCE